MRRAAHAAPANQKPDPVQRRAVSTLPAGPTPITQVPALTAAAASFALLVDAKNDEGVAFCDGQGKATAGLRIGWTDHRKKATFGQQ